MKKKILILGSNSFSGNSYFNNLTVSGYYKNSTYIPYIKGALTISNGFTYDTYGVRVFLEGDLVTSGSGTSSWSSTGAGILSNTQADMYLHLLGSSPKACRENELLPERLLP